MRSTPRLRARHRVPAHRAALATTGIAMLVCATLTPQAAASGAGEPSSAALPMSRDNAPADDPDAQFEIPDVFGPTEVLTDPEQLRTGGVNCSAPEMLPPNNAGDNSGQGYRVPFRMAITDGRSLAGYSPTAKQFDQLPFGSGVLGTTGWVRGWVELPSLELDIPEDGVTLCDGAQAYWESLVTSGNSDNFDLPPGAYWGMTTYPDGFTSASVHTTQQGPAHAKITGLDSTGGVQFRTSMPLALRIQQAYRFGGTGFDCTVDIDMTLSTDPGPLVESFDPVPTPFPDPADWDSQEEYEKYYQPYYPVNTPAPRKYQMPSNSLDTASTGGDATAANVDISIPLAYDSPENPGHCTAPQGTQPTVSNILAPKGKDTGLSAVTEAEPVQHGADGTIGWPVQPGSVQTSVDISVDDIGIQQGLPEGFGFK